MSKISISNIAWSGDLDTRIYQVMKEYGLSGLEIAPTRVFQKEPYDKLIEAGAWAGKLKKQYGFIIPSMQSIWFGRQERLFGTEEERRELVNYTKKAIEFPALQAQLWDRLRNQQFEDAYAIADIQLQDIPRYLNCEAYFDILNMPVPTSIDRYAHYLVEDGIIAKQDNGLYAITNLGAILFAKRLSEFPRVGRKAIRIVQYDGLNRLVILKEETTTEGYAISFENAVKYVNTLLPSKEDIDSVRRKSISTFPIPAIREAIANSLIHQDFFITGTGPLIEVFENRVEVTNSGTPLVDIMRIVDNPPKSRNEKLASLMRRLNMCEELGRGWDRMVISCELQKLPAPRIQIYQESTKVSLFSHLDFTNIPMEDKIWATYLHACIKYIEGDALTNSSLRERFGVAESSSGSISRLIKEVLKNKLIKPIDPNTAPRYMKYIPIWG